MKMDFRIQVDLMKKMMRLFLALTIAAFGWTNLALAKGQALALTAEQQQAVRRVNDYINSFQSLKSDFAQVSSKGTLTNGILYISKPGKLRFEYAAPNPLLIVADGRWLTIKDRLREKGDQFPLSATPLRLVVSPQIDLLAETNVIAFDSKDGVTTVSLEDKKSNMGGYITLIFDEQLNQLQQWVVVDGKNRRTSVQLSHIQLGGKFDPKLFIGEIKRDGQP